MRKKKALIYYFGVKMVIWAGSSQVEINALKGA